MSQEQNPVANKTQKGHGKPLHGYIGYILKVSLKTFMKHGFHSNELFPRLPQSISIVLMVSNAFIKSYLIHMTPTTRIRRLMKEAVIVMIITEISERMMNTAYKIESGFNCIIFYLTNGL